MEVNDSGVGIHDPNVSVEEVSVQSSERSAKKHYCATCNVTLLSNIEHEIHQKGKKHRAKADASVRHLRTIHVTGFPLGATPATLKALLAPHVGPVDHMTITPTHRYAFATLPTTSARDAAVALDVIAVHGHPDLADFVLTLSAATPVKDGHKPDHGNIARSPHTAVRQEYWTVASQAAETIGDDDTPRHRLLTQILAIGAKHKRECSASRHGAAVLGDLKSYLHRLFKSSADTFGLHEDDDVIMGNGDTCEDSTSTGHAAPYTFVDVEPYGSYVTGLGIHGNSDLDVSIRMVENVGHTASTATTQASMDSTFAGHILGVVKQHLVQHKPHSGASAPVFRFVALRLGKCPVAQLHHVPTGVVCDITVNNTLSVRNTALLLAYTRHTPLFSQVTHVVKAWALACHLRPLSGYALALMVLAYLLAERVVPNLQVRAAACPACHPPATALTSAQAQPHKRRASSPEVMPVLDPHSSREVPGTTGGRGKRRRVNGVLSDPSEVSSVPGVPLPSQRAWDTSFCECTGSANEVPGTKSADVAVIDFFNFLAKHSWKTRGISVRSAHGTEKRALLTCDNRSQLLPAQVPGSISVEEIQGATTLATEGKAPGPTPVVVEDPFELTHNTARRMGHATAKTFFNAIKATDKVLRDTLDLTHVFSAEIVHTTRAPKHSRPHPETPPTSGDRGDPSRARQGVTLGTKTQEFKVPVADTSAVHEVACGVLRGMGVRDVVTSQSDAPSGTPTLAYGHDVVTATVYRDTWSGSRRARRQAARTAVAAANQPTAATTNASSQTADVSPRDSFSNEPAASGTQTDGLATGASAQATPAIGAAEPQGEAPLFKLAIRLRRVKPETFVVLELQGGTPGIVLADQAAQTAALCVALFKKRCLAACENFC